MSKWYSWFMMFLMISIPVMATPPNPSLGSAHVDGRYGEWDLTNDFFAIVHQATYPDMLYLRYSCEDEIMYALVIFGTMGSCGASIAIDDPDNKVATPNGIGAFAWTCKRTGFEAAFKIPAGDYHIIVVTGNTHPEGTACRNWPEVIVPDCREAVESYTWGSIKALYR